MVWGAISLDSPITHSGIILHGGTLTSRYITIPFMEPFEQDNAQLYTAISSTDYFRAS